MAQVTLIRPRQAGIEPEAIIYGLYIKFFKRRKRHVSQFEHLDRINLPAIGAMCHQSSDPAIVVNSGNPARGLASQDHGFATVLMQGRAVKNCRS